MKNKILFIFFEIFLVTIFLFILPPLFIREEYLIDHEGGYASFNLSEGRVFKQEIDPPVSNLKTFALQMKNPLIQNNSLITINLNDQAGNLVRDFTFYGANVADPSWVKLKTPPLPTPVSQIEIFIDEKSSFPLYLYLDKQNLLDLKISTYYASFSYRFQQNLLFQFRQFQQRSLWHNLGYFGLLFILNTYLFFTPHEKKTAN